MVNQPQDVSITSYRGWFLTPVPYHRGPEQKPVCIDDNKNRHGPPADHCLLPLGLVFGFKLVDEWSYGISQSLGLIIDVLRTV